MPILRGVKQVLVASGLRSASGDSGRLSFTYGSPGSATFSLVVTASSSPTTLDLYLQTSLDGSTWIDFGHFSQIGAVATAASSLQWARSQKDATQATQSLATGDGVLAAGKAVNGPIIDNWIRVKWVIVGTSYTFAVSVIWDQD